MIKSMLPIVDSFELARGQLQPSNQGEQKIDSAYQVSQHSTFIDRASCCLVVFLCLSCHAMHADRASPLKSGKVSLGARKPGANTLPTPALDTLQMLDHACAHIRNLPSMASGNS